MRQARKFGTFGGVFTPSILTILGVIMYLRLPSIVGQGGLFGALGVIIIAHVISVTTGLSVASVATDRKVRGGGTYYMLSRSLGLPIGGTLGIALFVGLSFAVSLYIIGFAESFLGFWGIDATINAIRIVGVVVLLFVTIVTLISTSLALRAQFFILAAIALSLLSIVLGVGRHELAPASTAGAALDVLPAAAPFIVLFGIFFPAVTGFEERRLAARAVAHYRRGFEGALLVLGQPYAGKSALVRNIAEEHFEDAPVVRVIPPRERSTRPDALLDAVAIAVGATHGGDDPLMAAPTGAVVIFEDLDQWWERSRDGYCAIDAALELMERHVGRLVFLASADVHAFRFIDRVHDIRRRFLSAIECRPFSAREIGEVVQLRHGSTGFVFEVDGVAEDRMSGMARARLFNGLFDYSGGNIGSALHGWITHIRSVDGERVRVVRPAAPDLTALDALDPVHRLLLVQLLLHRGLDSDRLVRLGGARPGIVAAPLAELRRARVIVDDAHGLLVINPFLRPFVARRFTELELIE